MKVENAFDSIAREWDDYRFAPIPVLPLFLSMLPSNSARSFTILDAGCGNGRNAIEIARHAKRVIAIDVSAKMLGYAKRRVKAAGLSNVKLVKADFAVKIPLPDASVDAAFYIASLHHLRAAEQKRAFREMRRVVKRGGLVFITVWNKAQRKFWARRAKSFFVPWTTRSGERVKRFHYFFEKSELEALGVKNGFEVVNSFFEARGARAHEEKAKNLCVVFRKINNSE